jgi:protein-L-isoaspartate(D-aspartate) O-methyltransferase
MTDPREQRINMVESQVRTSDVTDRRLLKAMLTVPREAFVPDKMRTMAYMDEAVPVSSSGESHPRRYLLPPRTLAKLLQAAEIEETAVVLDVGCATGYSTAVLAMMSNKVVGLESDPALAEFAELSWKRLGIDNAIVIRGDLPMGAPEQGPFDAIIVNGAVPDVSRGLLEQLREGGRLAAVIDCDDLARAQVWQRTGKTFDSRPIFDAAARPLPGFVRAAGFVF